jgi:apolipoprotein N-acyltransferase
MGAVFGKGARQGGQAVESGFGTSFFLITITWIFVSIVFWPVKTISNLINIYAFLAPGYLILRCRGVCNVLGRVGRAGTGHAV